MVYDVYMKVKITKTKKRIIITAVLVLSGLAVFGIFNSFAGTGEGVAYDWRKPKVEFNYNKMSKMPEG